MAKFMENLEVAQQVLKNEKVYVTKPTRDTRQVSPGSLVVDTVGRKVYMCVTMYGDRDGNGGMWWVLVGLDDGTEYSDRYHGEPDSGLPLDRFIEEIDPDRWVVIAGGKVSTLLAGCNKEKRL